MKSQIIVCIPTSFQNRQEVAAALTDRYGAEYVFMGRVFQSTITADSCTINICDRQTWLKSNSEFAGSKLDLVTRQQIDRCGQIIQLTSRDTGYAECLQIARLAQILLIIGGVAIEVESTGVFHSREKWLANYDSKDVFEIYSLYVQLIEGEDYYYSCGMHNFNKADVAISLDEDIGLAIYVMNVFNYYRLTESPILQDGHTFQADIGCPRYQLNWIEDREEVSTSPLYNPHGRWLLIALTSQ